MSEVLLQCREEIQSALFQFWQQESFSVCTEYKSKSNLAGVILSLPHTHAVHLSKQEEFTVMATPTKDLRAHIESNSQRPSVCIVLSSVDIYDKDQREIQETSLLANHDIAQWIHSFERDCLSLEKLGIRVVVLRLGHVMSTRNSQKDFLYAVQNDGLLSWVHSEDVCRCVDLCLRQNIPSGVYNLVAPTHATAKASTLFSLQKAKKFARNIINNRNKSTTEQKILVHTQKIVNYGFSFSHPTFAESLEKTYNF